jgi:hypothetical protein
MKTFLEPTVELLSFQPQEATLAEIAFENVTWDGGVASIANWWDNE